MDWARILAYVTGTVDQELLARNEYLVAEDRIMKAQLKGRLKLSDAEREALGGIGHLRRHGLPPAPERKRTTTWAAFVRTHVALLTGTDFFTAEVLTLRGLVTYYVLFLHPSREPPGRHRRDHRSSQ
jgi:hypothetical protein